MTQSLGQLPNAPLVYVLAHILITRVPKMGDIWEDFHQKVFDIYPDSEIEHVQRLSMKAQSLETSTETVWQLLSRDKRRGIILRSNALILHTTGYTNSKDFFNDLGFALKSIVEVLPANIQVSRLGLRYLDLLLPSGGLDINQQVVEEFRIVDLSSLNCKPTHSERVIRYQTPINGELIVRHRQSVEPDLLPGDLFPNHLNPAPLLTKPKPENAMVGLLDFDHFLKTEMPLERDGAIKHFFELQKITSAAFRAVTTSQAMKEWKKAKQEVAL